MRLKIGSKVRVESILKAITCLIGLLGYLAVLRYIDILYSLLFPVVLLISFLFEKRRNFLIPRSLLNTVSLGVILFTVLRITPETLVINITEAFVILLAIKFLEKKRFRDYMQIYTISFFMLSASALITVDIIFLLYFFLLIFLLTVAVVLLSYHTEDPALVLDYNVVYRILSKSLLIPAAVIPLTALFFVILPRHETFLFDLSAGINRARSGFTDSIRLGSVSEIQEDSSVIFRAKMERIDPDLLYWRGIVFDFFDGTTWRRSEKSNTGKAATTDIKGRRVSQQIYLEPYQGRYLFAIDKPVLVRSMKKRGNFIYSLSKRPEKRIIYKAISVLSDTIPADSMGNEMYLQLPGRISSKITGLVKEISLNRSKKELTEHLLRFLKDGSYRYEGTTRINVPS
jgi:hypothetical protein